MPTDSIAVSSESAKEVGSSTAAGTSRADPLPLVPATDPADPPPLNPKTGPADPPPLSAETAPAAVNTSLSLSTAAMMSLASSSAPQSQMHMGAPPTKQSPNAVQDANEGLQSATITQSGIAAADCDTAMSSQVPDASSPFQSQHPSSSPELHSIPASIPTVSHPPEETVAPSDSHQTAAALLNAKLPTGAVFHTTDKAKVTADVPSITTASQAAPTVVAAPAASKAEGIMAGFEGDRPQNCASTFESQLADYSQAEPIYAAATAHQASNLKAPISHPQYIYAGLPPSVTTPSRAAVSPANALRTQLALTAQAAPLPSSMQTVNTEPLSPAEVLRSLVSRASTHTVSTDTAQAQMHMTPASTVTHIQQVNEARTDYGQTQVAASHPSQAQLISFTQQLAPKQAAAGLSSTPEAAPTHPDSMQSQPMTHISQQPQAGSFAAGHTAGERGLPATQAEASWAAQAVPIRGISSVPHHFSPGAMPGQTPPKLVLSQQAGKEAANFPKLHAETGQVLPKLRILPES